MIGHIDLMLEKNVVWRFDLKDYPWLRETFADFPQREGITKAIISNHQRCEEQIVGYMELENDAPPTKKGRNKFTRRIFVLRKGDYEAYKDHYSFPTESINPLTVEPKQKGLQPSKTQ
nr:DUF6009 family protein [Nostoc sp. ChiSLP03a]MDZ8213885.1 DUF6009 family protein [Nostoc sp. ChiSLP03a]